MTTNEYLQGDAKDLVPQIEREVGLWVTDPPYIPFTGGGGQLAKCANYDLLTDDKLAIVAGAMNDKTVKNGMLCWFTSKSLIHKHIPMLESYGWTFKTMVFWHKTQGGLGNWRGQIEPILIMAKGKGRTHNQQGKHTDVLRGRDHRSYGGAPGQNGSHNRKPTWLYTRMIQAYALEGDLLADPFAGTNPLGAAGRALGYDTWACDIEPREQRKEANTLEAWG